MTEFVFSVVIIRHKTSKDKVFCYYENVLFYAKKRNISIEEKYRRAKIVIIILFCTLVVASSVNVFAAIKSTKRSIKMGECNNLQKCVEFVNFWDYECVDCK